MEPPECDPDIVKRAETKDTAEIYTFLEKIRALTGNALRARTQGEIQNNIDDFVVICEGGNVIACGQIFQTDNSFTLELWALATDPQYQWQWLSDKIIDYAEKFAKRERKYLILVTNNPILGQKLIERWYRLASLRYAWREQRSPTKSVYMKY